MNIQRPNDAPACFGAASVFAHDSETCRACVAFEACSQESLNTLEKIKGIIDVRDLMRRHELARSQSKIVRAKKDTSPADTALTTVTRKTPTDKTVMAQISTDHENVILGLKTKGKVEALRLCRSGAIDRAKVELHQGINTFATGAPRYIASAAQLLIYGGFTKRSLCECYVKELGWAETSAAPHVSIVIGVFVGFGIAQEKDKVFTLAPVSVRDN